MCIRAERLGRRASWVAMAIATAVLLAPAPTTAHPHVCDHDHPPSAPAETTCTNPGQTVTVRQQTRQCRDSLTGLSRCLPNGPLECGVEAYLEFLGVTPSPGSYTYNVSSSMQNQTAVYSFLLLLTDYSGVSDPLTGSLTLDFGLDPFPTVPFPVEITGLDLTLHTFNFFGGPTGPINMHLLNTPPLPAPQFLLYDPDSGFIEPMAGNDGIAVEVDYAFATDEPTTVWLRGNLTASSKTFVIGADADLPFLPVPGLAPAAVTVLLLAIAGTGFLMLRRLRQRPARAS